MGLGQVREGLTVAKAPTVAKARKSVQTGRQAEGKAIGVSASPGSVSYPHVP